MNGLSCKKFVQVSAPITGLSSTSVYADNATAAAVLTSIYSNMMAGENLSDGENSIGILDGLAADELTYYYLNDASVQDQFYQNALTSSKAYYWTELFKETYVANAALAGLQASTGVTASLKQELIGESKFMRAFLNFYGVNLYGSYPLVTTTNYLTNNVIQRSPITAVYQQIVSDLKDAQSELSPIYLGGDAQTPSSDRGRPTKWAAAALLSRVYLYTNDWADAEAESDTVINNTNLFSLDSLNKVFLANSTEAIWQLDRVNPGYNTYSGYRFILTGSPNLNHPFYLSDSLLSAFENGDERYANWVDSVKANGVAYHFAYKYKIGTYNVNNPVTESLMVLRLAEQYLIRAEARLMQGNIAGAQQDINVIRSRAGLPNTVANNNISLHAAILHERQVELFTEWGHRWLDLIRSGEVSSVMSVVTPQKGGSWSMNWTLCPIPAAQIALNSNLTQNPGY